MNRMDVQRPDRPVLRPAPAFLIEHVRAQLIEAAMLRRCAITGVFRGVLTAADVKLWHDEEVRLGRDLALLEGRHE